MFSLQCFFNSIYSRSGVGSHYGTFGGPVTAFSAVEKEQQKYRPAGKNFLTNPGKRGTGYGLVFMLPITKQGCMLNVQ